MGAELEIYIWSLTEKEHEKTTLWLLRIYHAEEPWPPFTHRSLSAGAQALYFGTAESAVRSILNYLW